MPRRLDFGDGERVRERDTVRFELAGKRRRGIVIEVQGDLVRVAYDCMACLVTHAE